MKKSIGRIAVKQPVTNWFLRRRVWIGIGRSMGCRVANRRLWGFSESLIKIIKQTVNSS